MRPEPVARCALHTIVMPEVPCPTCGEPNDGVAHFCRACGSSLEQNFALRNAAGQHQAAPLATEPGSSPGRDLTGLGARPGEQSPVTPMGALERPAREIERLVGQTVGDRYHIKRVIAEGGMGVVYAAEQKMGTHVREVAVKTLLPELSRDRTTVQRFYRECGTVSELEHPNTIRVYDFGEAPDGSLFIAMEYVRGESLGAAIEKAGALPVVRTLRILDQIAGALHEAHEKGIVHRDLKPDNIILTERAGESDFVKLLDFGIAARANAGTAHETRLTQQGTVLGTPPYMSPEQFSGGVLNRQSDIYSLGVIAYEMLSGKLPFDGESPWQWAHQHMAVPPPELDPSLPADVRAAVLRALAKRPGERPATVRDFVRQAKGEIHFDTAPTTPDDGAPPGARTSPMPALAGPPGSAMQPDDTPVGTQQGPAVLPGVGVPHPGYSPVGTQQGPAITPGAGAVTAASLAFPKPRRRRKRGLGLSLSIGALLLVGAGVGYAVWWHATSGSSPVPPLPSASSAPPTVDIAPLGLPSIDPPATVPRSPAPAPQRTPAAPKPPAKSTTAPAPSVAPTGSAPETSPGIPPFTLPSGFPTIQIPGLPFPIPGQQQPSTSPGGQTQPSSGTSTGSSAATAACTQAVVLARAQAIEQAVDQYHACQQAGGSANELSAARRQIGTNAAAAVKSRATQQDCQGAQSAAHAAASIGVGGPAERALQTSGC